MSDETVIFPAESTAFAIAKIQYERLRVNFKLRRREAWIQQRADIIMRDGATADEMGLIGR